MTHQYVGAYYVPHGWYENYDPEFQYDPLSTVFYKNAWYILKQPAPVGTVPSDKKYWVQYSLVPGQITDIENKIDDIYSMLSNKAPLDTSLRYLLISDSWATGYNETEPYVNFLDSKFNITVSAQDGAGFTNGMFLNLLKNADLNNFDAIIVFGGTNDQPKTDVEIMAGINSFYNYLSSFNKKLIIGYLGINNTRAVQAYKTACLNNGITYIANSEKITYRNDWFTSSNHPTQEFQNTIAHYINMWLNSGYISINVQTKEFPITSTSDYTVTGTPKILSFINDGIVHINVPSLNFTGSITSGTKILADVVIPYITSLRIYNQISYAGIIAGATNENFGGYYYLSDRNLSAYFNYFGSPRTSVVLPTSQFTFEAGATA